MKSLTEVPGREVGKDRFRNKVLAKSRGCSEAWSCDRECGSLESKTKDSFGGCYSILLFL